MSFLKLHTIPLAKEMAKKGLTATPQLPQSVFMLNVISKFVGTPFLIEGGKGFGVVAAEMACDLAQSMEFIRDLFCRPIPNDMPDLVTFAQLIKRFDDGRVELEEVLFKHGASSILHKLNGQFGVEYEIGQSRTGSYSEAVWILAKTLYLHFLCETNPLDYADGRHREGFGPPLVSLACIVKWDELKETVSDILNPLPRLRQAIKLELKSVSRQETEARRPRQDLSVATHQKSLTSDEGTELAASDRAIVANVDLIHSTITEARATIKLASKKGETIATLLNEETPPERPVVTLGTHPQILLNGQAIALRIEQAEYVKALIEHIDWMSKSDYDKMTGGMNTRPDRIKKTLPPEVLTHVETRQSRGSRWI